MENETTLFKALIVFFIIGLILTAQMYVGDTYAAYVEAENEKGNELVLDTCHYPHQVDLNVENNTQEIWYKYNN